MRARWVELAVVLALSRAMLLAQDAAPQQAGYVVAGRMVDAVRGTPLVRAVVDLAPLQADGTPLPASHPAGSAAAADAEQVPEHLTGADGSFRFGSVSAGLYALRASRRGYLRESLDQHGSFFAGVVVGLGHTEAEQIRFALQPEAEIHGTVRDSSGDPVEAGQVQLFAQAFDGTGQVRRVRNGFIQQGSSQYEFSDLAPGTYYVAVTAQPWFAVHPSGDSETGGPGALNVAYPTTFYDAVERSDSAQALVVTAGERVAADFHLQAVPAIEVKQPAGRGIGSPAFGETLWVPMQMVYPEMPPGSGTQAAARPKPTEPPVPTMQAWVAPGEYAREVGGVMTTFSLTGDIRDTTLPGETATGSVAVTGRVAMVDGSAFPSGAAVVLAPVVSGFSGGSGGNRFFRMGVVDPGAAGSIALGVQADGGFTGQVPAERQYRVSARAGGKPCAVTGLAATGAQVTHAVELTVGSTPVMLAATLARADGFVQGRALGLDGRPAAGVMVLLVPEDLAVTELYRQDESNLDGSFRLNTVAAGRYRVLAIADGWGIAWKDATVLGKYLAGGEQVQGDGTSGVVVAQPVVVQAR